MLCTILKSDTIVHTENSRRSSIMNKKKKNRSLEFDLFYIFASFFFVFLSSYAISRTKPLQDCVDLSALRCIRLLTQNIFFSLSLFIFTFYFTFIVRVLKFRKSKCFFDLLEIRVYTIKRTEWNPFQWHK